MGTFWFTLGGLVSILRLSIEYLEPFLARSSMVLEKGKVPNYSRCYTMNTDDPPEGELYKQYVNNAHDKQAIKKHFLYQICRSISS